MQNVGEVGMTVEAVLYFKLCLWTHVNIYLRFLIMSFVVQQECMLHILVIGMSSVFQFCSFLNSMYFNVLCAPMYAWMFALTWDQFSRRGRSNTFPNFFWITLVWFWLWFGLVLLQYFLFFFEWTVLWFWLQICLELLHFQFFLGCLLLWFWIRMSLFSYIS